MTTSYADAGWTTGPCESCGRKLSKYQCFAYPVTRHKQHKRPLKHIDGWMCIACGRRAHKRARMLGEYYLTKELIEELWQAIRKQKELRNGRQDHFAIAAAALSDAG